MGDWDAELYDAKHSFVFEMAGAVLELLSPQPGERILDLGCGTGHLTARLASMGASVVGIDASPAMIAAARRRFPHLDLRCADAQTFASDAPMDAVFSNATLHWIRNQDAMLRCVFAALRSGGRFVAEMGGFGNVESVIGAIREEFRARTGRPLDVPMYFPTAEEYARRLDQAGFLVRSIVLHDRPTPLQDGDRGLRSWLEGFGGMMLEQFAVEERAAAIGSIEHRLRAERFMGGRWILDYRRLRFEAQRPTA